MFKAIEVILENSFYKSYNGILFYLQKIPLFGKLIKDSLYKVHVLGNLIVFCGIIFELIGSILKKILYYLLIKNILLYIFGKFEISLSPQYILSFFIVLSVVGFIQTIDYFSAYRDDYIYVKLMRIEPRDYYRSKIYYNVFFNIISYTLVFGIVFNNLGFVMKDAFSYACFLFGLRIFAIIGNTNLYKIKKKKRERINFIITILFLIIFVIYLAYVLYMTITKANLFWENKISYNSDIFFIVSIIVLTLSFILLYKTKKIEQVSKINLRRDLFEIDIDINTSSLKLENQDLEGKIKTGNFEKYKGIEYINRIFFDRFKSKFYKPIRNRFIVVFILLLIANIMISRLNITKKEDLEFFTYGFPLIGLLAGFLIYIGDKFTRICFYNMDRFLMKNNFYRSPKILSESIKIRFKKMLLYNSPILIVLILGLLGILYQIKVSWYSYILTIVFSIFGLVFFNFHYLYAYYLIQPFTENMEIKNPIYSIFNIFSYYIFIALIAVVRKYELMAIFGILIFLTTYVILGFILVKKHADKRFKLR